MVIDGKPVFGPTMDGAKEAFVWLNKLYANGLIDPEFFNLDFPTQAAKYRDENYIMVGFGNGWTMQNNVGQYLDDYVLIEPLIGPHGDQYWQSDPYNFRMIANTSLITTSCEDVDAAVRFYDLCFDPWNNLQLAYGSEGIGFELDADGTPVFLTVPEGMTDGEWKFVNGHDASAPGGVSDAWEKTIKGTNDSFFKYDADNYYSPFFLPDARYPSVKWDKDTQDELAILKTDINTYCDTAFVDFVMNGDVEAKWQEYLDTLERMGLPRLMEIYQAGYEANK
jgi:putative aldouronate transport system substrate-binding protein